MRGSDASAEMHGASEEVYGSLIRAVQVDATGHAASAVNVSKGLAYDI
ncbi:hypothetical protein [Rhodovulum adriaticum]|uniref:Uncharacterized protein n=1 Tax=Rhodovulum adriaticum TaxID=35804 RepID=A0A4R2P1R2_RHOAD|nr:hypothetical protein [Rhodovulum adriaticum]TCP27605.1 hypothetical protein EV656_101514 [Rhodovulum adriaticum]